MDCDGWEITLAQEFIKLCGTDGTLDEDDDLVELEIIKQLVQLTVLLLLVKFDIILLQAVKSQLSLIIYVNFEWVLHELLADWSDFLRERGAEHHDLFLGRGRTEDLLHITAHIYGNQHIQVNNPRQNSYQ